MIENEKTDSITLCHYCRQSIPVDASKCHHCGEQLAVRSQGLKAARKIFKAIGIGTAILSLFFGLKEAYFFIQERQQQRAMASSYFAAAERFLKLDSLTYAEESLKRALSINPNDQHLRARIFFLRADHLLREADFYGMQIPENRFDIIPEMIVNGFSLLSNSLSTDDRARLLFTLARLLQYDRQWQASTGISDLFAQAYMLVPGTAEIAYWYGEWLLKEETSKEQGFTLIEEAAAADPNIALYASALGRVQAELGDYRAAFQTLMQTIDSRPDQHELHNIRAANEAKRILANALVNAHEVSPITGTEFFGMTLDDRIAVTRYALKQSSKTQLQLLAARLLHHAGHNDEAEILIRKKLGSYSSRNRTEELELFAAILDAQHNRTERQQVLDILATKKEMSNYEEILETGFKDKHWYKVGLKLVKEEDVEGVLVITAYEHYPFHKAGVMSGDRLLKFGHRSIHDMSSITRLILSFTPGTDVPLKIRRGNVELDLTVTVE